jgi:hypothetical protein
MERKTLPKTALPRIYRIDEMIASGRYPSTKQLAKAYETSMSSSRSEGSNFGVFAGEVSYRFCIDFFEPAAFAVRERSWAADQAVADIEGGHTDYLCRCPAP